MSNPTVPAIPTGDTLETVFDRMTRASNFASNGVYLGQTDPTPGTDPADTAALYIRQARRMLDEAEAALDAYVASSAVESEATA